MRDRLIELQRLAQSLVSRAGPLDRSPVREQRAALDALQLLGTLGDTALQSLTAPTATKTPAPAATPRTSAPRKPEPQPSLKNEDLVNALLQYSKRRRSASTGRSTLIKAEDLDQGQAHDADGDENFAPMKVPHVEAQPKSGISTRRPLDGAAYPIMRDSSKLDDEPNRSKS